MKKLTTIAASAAIVASFAAGNAVASENPFGMQQVNSDVHVAMSEGTCGEGKCGENKGKKEGKCGAEKGKKEGKCGGSE